MLYPFVYVSCYTQSHLFSLIKMKKWFKLLSDISDFFDNASTGTVSMGTSVPPSGGIGGKR